MIRILLCVAGLTTSVAAQQSTSIGQGAILRGLDKISGQTTDLQMPIGSNAQLGRLTITLTDCRYPAGNLAGDAFAGLQVRETGQVEPVFSGWMIASAPALSAMDHNRYDVWVIRCTIS
ncbi:MAG: DUF2155 domain-containing protein [Paracoccaceae bacterium]